jgi:hypothetical protein
MTIHSWRVFHVGSAGTRHLAPCDAKGHILSAHTLTDNCPCGPLLTEQYSLVRVHHAEMQHGSAWQQTLASGSNAVGGGS